MPAIGIGDVAPVHDPPGDGLQGLGVGVPSRGGSGRERAGDDTGDVVEDVPVYVTAALQMMPPLVRLYDDQWASPSSGLDEGFLGVTGTASRVAAVAEPPQRGGRHPRQWLIAGDVAQQHAEVIGEPELRSGRDRRDGGR